MCGGSELSDRGFLARKPLGPYEAPVYTLAHFSKLYLKFYICKYHWGFVNASSGLIYKVSGFNKPEGSPGICIFLGILRGLDVVGLWTTL